MIKDLIDRFFAALSFLTAIPVPARDRKALAGSVLFFPLVGILIGALQWALWLLLGAGGTSYCLNCLILVLAGILLTRALHLDGLADSADAFLSHKDSQKMLEIMRDSRIGTMGAMAVLFDVLVRWQILSAIPFARMGQALLIFPVLGRVAMATGMLLFNYARSQGLVSEFLQGLRKSDLIAVLCIGLFVCILLLGLPGMVIFFSALLIALLAFGAAQKKLGGFTGDVLGAVNELVEIISLFIFLILL